MTDIADIKAQLARSAQVVTVPLARLLLDALATIEALEGERDANIEASSAEILRLRTDLGALKARLDGMDCTHREGGDTRHCPLERKCLRCQVDQLRTEIEVGVLLAVVPKVEQLRAWDAARARIEALRPRDGAPTDYGLGFESAIDAALAALEEK